MKRTIVTLMVLLAAVLFAACGSTQTQTQANSTGVTSYYVCANGNDSNAGTSENAPFKTLAKAIQEASKTTVKKITVIGTLTGNTVIRDTGSDEILITGKPDTVENEKAVIITESGILLDIHNGSKIRLEYITLSGALNSTGVRRGLTVSDGAIITLGKNVVITQFDVGSNNGAGIYLEGTLYMTDNALITGNTARAGGGLRIAANGSATMQDESSITYNTSTVIEEGIGGGGVSIGGRGTFTMRGSSSIYGNKAVCGGGIFIQSGTLIIEGNAAIRDNEANVGSNSLLYGGGGIYIWGGSAALKENSLVTGNRAIYGGGVYTKGNLVFEGGRISGQGGAYQFNTGSIRGNSAGNGSDVWENYQ